MQPLAHRPFSYVHERVITSWNFVTATRKFYGRRYTNTMNKKGGGWAPSYYRRVQKVHYQFSIRGTEIRLKVTVIKRTACICAQRWTRMAYNVVENRMGGKFDELIARIISDPLLENRTRKLLAQSSAWPLCRWMKVGDCVISIRCHYERRSLKYQIKTGISSILQFVNYTSLEYFCCFNCENIESVILNIEFQVLCNFLITFHWNVFLV